jgi:hypothetical protein
MLEKASLFLFKKTGFGNTGFSPHGRIANAITFLGFFKLEKIQCTAGNSF